MNISMSEQQFTKKQHYIPQFYLKKFSQDGERVYVYDKKTGSKGEIRYQTTLQVAHENNFYNYQTKSGKKENLEDFFSQIEGDAATAIEEAYDKRRLSDNDRGKLALFIAFIYSRVPAFKERTEESHTKMGEKISRMMFRMTPKEKFRNFLKEQGKEVTDDELDDLIEFATNPKRSKIGFTYPNGYWIKSMLDMGAELAPRFAAMDWLFLIADKPFAFITSDNPFILMPPKEFHPFYGYGLVTQGAKKIIPLKSNMCLIMGDIQDTPNTVFGDTNKEFYRGINSAIMFQSRRFCFSPEIGKLEKLVKVVKPYKIKRVGKVVVE